MTKRQIKICKAVQRYKRLPEILEKAKIEDYLELQELLPFDAIRFSNHDMDEKTVVTLTDQAVEAVETYNEQRAEMIFTRTLAIWGGITGSIAIVIELVRLFP